MFRASAFKLNMFETCAQQYKFTYIDQLGPEYKTPRPYLTMGAHVHNALHDLYAQVKPEERSYEKLEELLRKRWRENRQGFLSREDEAKWGTKALQMLRLYTHRMDLKHTPVMLEDYYDTEITTDIKVVGRIDRADALPDGTLHVIDYKTGKYKEDEVSNTQLELYALIVAANEKKPVTKASYLYLQTMQWHTIDITPEATAIAAQGMISEVEKIKQEKAFAPHINPYCKNCDFLVICPARAEIEKQIENATQEAQTMSPAA